SDYFYNARPESGVYPAEEVNLQFTVTNFGQSQTTGGTISIAQIDGPATLLSGTTSVPPLAGRDTFEITSSDLRFVVYDTAANGELITLTLNWLTNEGQTAEVKAFIPVRKAGLHANGIDFGSHVGIAPGASGEVYLTVSNTGGEAIDGGVI